MSALFYIRRTLYPPLFMLTLGMAFLTLLLAGRFDYITVIGSQSDIVVFWGLLIFSTVAFYSAALVLNRTPIISFFKDRIELYPVNPFSWFEKPVVLYKDKIIDCKTDYDFEKEYGPQNLIFVMNNANDIVDIKKSFIKKQDKKIYYNYSLSELDTYLTIDIINAYLNNNNIQSFLLQNKKSFITFITPIKYHILVVLGYGVFFSLYHLLQ